MNYLESHETPSRQSSFSNYEVKFLPNMLTGIENNAESLLPKFIRNH